MSVPTPPRTTRDGDAVAVIATWARRIGLPLAILAWSAVALLLLWLAGHVIQALLIAIWIEWHATHPKEFQRAKDDLAEKVEGAVVETPSDPEPPLTLLS